jgi:hypothetical protein
MDEGEPAGIAEGADSEQQKDPIHGLIQEKCLKF